MKPEAEIATCSCGHELSDHHAACTKCKCIAYRPVAKTGRKCVSCGQMQVRHKIVDGQFLCDNGKPSPGFDVQRQQPGRVSQSFWPEEIDFLDDLFKALLEGGDLKRFAPHPALAGVCRKIIFMRIKSADSMTQKALSTIAVENRK